MSMDSRDLDKVSESMDKVQSDQPDRTVSMDSVDIVHGLNGQSGQSPGSPGRLDNVHIQNPLIPLTDWTLFGLKKLKLK